MKNLIKILACPACQGDVEYVEKENLIVCKNCKSKYNVVKGIPVMLEKEAEKLVKDAGDNK